MSFLKQEQETGEAHSQHNLLIYIWRTRSHLGNLEHCCFSGRLVLRPLPQFLGAFSQSQMPNHTSTVPHCWLWHIGSVPWVSVWIVSWGWHSTRPGKEWSPRICELNRSKNLKESERHRSSILPALTGLNALCGNLIGDLEMLSCLRNWGLLSLEKKLLYTHKILKS
jgi:hypothetical protein